MTESRGLSVLERVALLAGAAVVVALLFGGHADPRDQARLRLESLAGALRDYHRATGTLPDEEAWFHQLKTLKPRPPEYMLHMPRDYFDYDPASGRGRVFDPWDRPLRYERLPDSRSFRLISSGPEAEDPSDDIVVAGPS